VKTRSVSNISGFNEAMLEFVASDSRVVLETFEWVVVQLESSNSANANVRKMPIPVGFTISTLHPKQFSFKRFLAVVIGQINRLIALCSEYER
jgi:hypothetical protein